MIIDDEMKEMLKVCDVCTCVFWWTGDDEAKEHLCDFCTNKAEKLKDFGKRELGEEINKKLPKFKNDILIEVTRMLDKRL